MISGSAAASEAERLRLESAFDQLVAAFAAADQCPTFLRCGVEPSFP